MTTDPALSPLTIKKTRIERFEYKAPDIYFDPDIVDVEVRTACMVDGDPLGGFCLFLAVLFQLVDAEADTPISVGVSLGGEFAASMGEYPDDATLDQVRERVGAQAIGVLYGKARELAELSLTERRPPEPLPLIDPVQEWRCANSPEAIDVIHLVDVVGPVEAFAMMDDEELDEEYLNGEEFADEFDDEDEFADEEVPAIDRRINRGVAGMWKLTDDGTFELQEPFRTMLTEARVEATRGWTAGLIGYLEPRCNYTAQELTEELLRRNRVREDGSIAVFEEFVLEALGGDL